MGYVAIARKFLGRVGFHSHLSCPALLACFLGPVVLVLFVRFGLRERGSVATRLERRVHRARQLQDRLLQTIQASKLVADDALDTPRDTAHLLEAIGKLSAWMGQATQEAQAALHSLRFAEDASSMSNQARASFLDHTLASVKAWFTTRS